MDTLLTGSSVGLANNHRLLIQLRDVVKVYKTAAGDFTALKGITADIHSGEFVGVIGKSGAGKTTLLNMITGADEITSGEVIFIPPDGKSTSIHNLSENSLALWRGRNIGIIHQSFQLLPMLSLVENIMLPVDFSGNYQPRVSKERAFQLLKLVELEEHASKLPAYISGGQKQRVAIARALVNDPPVIVADEPTGSLDTLTAETIFQIFEMLIAEGRTIIMVTHDNNLGPRFTRRVLLSDGQVEADSGLHMLAFQEKR
ncbi:MAG: ABC transporter ATP-binding protein [Anaerolineales bacterium]|nr:ABC transporter ATP-binding protein [Anaerolineae bacterium]PWB55799.1 MAG: ABC transporter ATP-binding protein [Anaerolineales bacterium]